MSAIGRSLNRTFCLAVVVTLTLVIIPSSALALVLRSRQEGLPAELSLADAIAIYLERNVDFSTTRKGAEHTGASLSGNKDIALAEARRLGIQCLKEAFHVESAVGKNLSEAHR